MTMGEQSVRAMMPKFTLGASGASEALPAVAAHVRGRKFKTEAAPTNCAVRVRNSRRLSEDGGTVGESFMDEGRWVLGYEFSAVRWWAERPVR